MEVKMRFEVFKSKNKKWYWRLVAQNGRIIADGGQGYATRQNARRAVSNLQSNLDAIRLADLEVLSIKPKRKKAA
jgi:uncharacterized protein YegP (UPF0339 family)